VYDIQLKIVYYAETCREFWIEYYLRNMWLYFTICIICGYILLFAQYVVIFYHLRNTWLYFTLCTICGYILLFAKYVVIFYYLHNMWLYFYYLRNILLYFTICAICGYISLKDVIVNSTYSWTCFRNGGSLRVFVCGGISPCILL